MKNRPTLLIIDSNCVFRRTLRDIIQRHIPEIHIMEARSEKEGLQTATTCPTDWIVTDLHLNGATSLDMIHEIASKRPDTRIAVLTDMDEEEYRRAALEKGADYFISKSGTNGHSVLSIILDEMDGR